ncbi:MAG TPA: class I SAM-dependent methyltransferase [Thermoleophilaceae bacterium]|nr:class I SAM-dependent methyltransferase [Thermoleophilaceae bacterium]
MRVKGALRARYPERVEQLKVAVNAARRSLREPPAPRVADENLFWDPPPRNFALRPLRAGEVSEALHARLDEADLAAMLERLDEVDQARWRDSDESGRKMLALHFCVHYGVPGVLEKTGLSDVEPPADVTSLARGSLAAGGSFGYADIVADSLREAGHPLVAGQRVLDFGCSSGRVTRVLATAHPAIEWLGCDVDRGAVEWAAGAFPGVRFFAMDPDPPLPLGDAELDTVFAISIWTHYSEPAALRWFEEMHRLLRPGGHLLLTTIGCHSVQVHASDWGNWPRRRIAEAATNLYTDGFHFVGGYGKDLAHSTASPDWGQAFLTPEWLAHNLCPRWAIKQFEVGRVEAHSDLYVLERRD